MIFIVHQVVDPLNGAADRSGMTEHGRIYEVRPTDKPTEICGECGAEVEQGFLISPTVEAIFSKPYGPWFFCAKHIRLCCTVENPCTPAVHRVVVEATYALKSCKRTMWRNQRGQAIYEAKFIRNLPSPMGLDYQIMTVRFACKSPSKAWRHIIASGRPPTTFEDHSFPF